MMKRKIIVTPCVVKSSSKVPGESMCSFGRASCARTSSASTPPAPKKKREGVVYTPDFITRFIVEQTIGRTLEEIAAELLPKFGKANAATKYGNKAMAVFAGLPKDQVDSIAAFLAASKGSK